MEYTKNYADTLRVTWQGILESSSQSNSEALEQADKLKQEANQL